MAAMILVAKRPIRHNDVGPAASSLAVTLASTLKLTIPNKMRKIIIKAHFFMIFKDLRDNFEEFQDFMILVFNLLFNLLFYNKFVLFLVFVILREMVISLKDDNVTSSC